MKRRAWLRGAAALSLAPGGALAAPSLPALPAELAPPAMTPAALAGDADYWRRVAAQYDVTDKVAMLDNGY